MPFWACWLLNSAKPDGLVVASVIRTTFGCQAVRPVKTQNFRFAFHKGLAGITATPRRPSLCASAKQTTCPMTWPQNDPNVSLRVQQKNYNRKALHNPQRPAVLILESMSASLHQQQWNPKSKQSTWCTTLQDSMNSSMSCHTLTCSFECLDVCMAADISSSPKPLLKQWFHALQYLCCKASLSF